LEDAVQELDRAWGDLGLAWDEALTGIDMATLLEPADPEVRAAADSARDILTRLGAHPFIGGSARRWSNSRRHSTRPELGYIERLSDREPCSASQNEPSAIERKTPRASLVRPSCLPCARLARVPVLP
jgi:hypothetical protein